MEMNRRQTLSVLGLAAAAATLPASAAKATTPPVFETVALAGKLLAIVNCPVPVVAVTARVFSQDRTVEIGHYPLALTPDSLPTNGTWGASPTGVPLGNYWVEYEATSADDGAATRSTGFSLYQTPSYTLSVTPNVIDVDNRVVTVSGTVMGTHPVTQAVTPISGLAVKVGYFYTDQPPDPSPDIIVTSAADGSFSTQIILRGRARINARNDVDSEVNFVFSGYIDSVAVTVAKRTPRLTAAIDATEFDLGQTAAVSGVLEVLEDGQYRPLAGRTVVVIFDGPAPGGYHQVTTDGQGRFTHTVTPEAHGRYQVYFGGDPFYATTVGATARVLVRWPLAFDESSFVLTPTPSATDEPGRYFVDGRFRSASPYTLDELQVVLQFRARPEDPWQTLLTATGEFGDGYRFRTTFVPPRSGQVRAVVAQTDMYQAAASPAYHVEVPRVPVRPLSPDPTPGTLPPQRGI